MANGSKLQCTLPATSPVSAMSQVVFFFPVDQLHRCQHEPRPILWTCSYHGKLGKPLGNHHVDNFCPPTVEDNYPQNSFFFFFFACQFSYSLPTLSPHFPTPFIEARKRLAQIYYKTSYLISIQGLA